MRHAFQTECYGMTPAQRTAGAAAFNAALDSENVSEVADRIVNPNNVLRGLTFLFAQATFSVDAGGQRVFTAARNWASTRAVDATNDRGGLQHSYVRVRSIDEGPARLVTVRYAESPGWVEAVTTEPLD